MFKPQGPFVIKDVSAMSPKEIQHVEGKGKAIAEPAVNVTPKIAKAQSLLDPDASSSGMKIFVNRFGNSNAIPGYSAINVNSLNPVNKNLHSMADDTITPVVSKVSDVLPSNSASLGRVNPWSNKLYIKLDFKEEDLASDEMVEAVLSGGLWMPHLPLQCWYEVNVSRIASRIGKPLMLDGNMFQWGRREFARKDCLQVQPIPKEVEVETVKVGGGVEAKRRQEVLEEHSYGSWILVNNKNSRRSNPRIKVMKTNNLRYVKKDSHIVTGAQIVVGTGIRNELNSKNLTRLNAMDELLEEGECILEGDQSKFNEKNGVAEVQDGCKCSSDEARVKDNLPGEFGSAGQEGGNGVVPAAGVEVNECCVEILGRNRSDGEMAIDVGTVGELSKGKLAKELRSLGPIKKVPRGRKLEGGGSRKREGASSPRLH
ncbi:hypothetical protein M5K25_006887 [Dendrobium thyrsiflorum]|uniref:DUF4283 domain-containing protein n=1 Tax=Dendrobium thyrsiflorum TaxID=117978 RepID=A0ABD0VJZ9_DENTH